MLKNTSQHYHALQCYLFLKYFKSCFPAANIHWLNEDYATDTLFMDIAAHDDGVEGHASHVMVQLFMGLDSEHTAIYPMGTKAEYHHVLKEFIHDHGAMHSLCSDNKHEELSSHVKDIFKMYVICDTQSKANYQHQNPAKWHIQDIKHIYEFHNGSSCPLVVVVYVVCH